MRQSARNHEKSLCGDFIVVFCNLVEAEPFVTVSPSPIILGLRAEPINKRAIRRVVHGFSYTDIAEIGVALKPHRLYIYI